MVIFCLLWVPLFYLFRLALMGESSVSGGVWALVLGSITGLVQFFLGEFIEPGGFGFSRWLGACLDIVTVPALIPFVIYLILILLRIVPKPFDFASFALLWLIPVAAIRCLGWSASRDPMLLILTPLLWTSIAIGIPFLINCMMKTKRLYIAIPCGLFALTVPFCATSCWWAIYSQMFYIGFSLLAAVMLPLTISLVFSWIKRRADSEPETQADINSESQLDSFSDGVNKLP